MINALISDLQSPDPLVRVRAAPALGDLGAAAIKAIPALLSLTQDETQHPLIRVLAAAAVARIDPAQTGAILNCSRQRPEERRLAPCGCRCERTRGVGKARQTRSP